MGRGSGASLTISRSQRRGRRSSRGLRHRRRPDGRVTRRASATFCPLLQKDSSASGCARSLPEYKTLAEDDLEAALALQSEARP